MNHRLPSLRRIVVAMTETPHRTWVSRCWTTTRRALTCSRSSNLIYIHHATLGGFLFFQLCCPYVFFRDFCYDIAMIQTVTDPKLVDEVLDRGTIVEVLPTKALFREK